MSGDRRFLAGRTAWVTGGGSGQGRAIVLALAGAGANVAAGSLLSDHAKPLGEATYYPDGGELEKVRREAEALGVSAHCGRLDVCDAGSVREFHAEAARALGEIDILVNAAGVTGEQGVRGHPEDLWLRIINTNLNGAFRTTRECLPGMMRRGWGRVVNIASTAATVGWRDNPAYCASKSGLLGLTRCAALEGAAHGVTCNAISPTWVKTGLMKADVAQLARAENGGRDAAAVESAIAAENPQGRMLEPEETAAIVLFLCGEGARGVNAENITMSGGALW